MKFLLVNKFHYLKGGSEKYYFTLSQILRDHGHDVVYFAMKDEKNLPCDQSDFFKNKVSVDGSFSNKIKFIKNMNYSKEAYHKILALIEKEKPEVAILNLVHKQLTLSVVEALKEKRVKIIWVMHDLITVCPSYTMLDGNGNICEKCLHGDFRNCLKNSCIKNSKIMSYLAMREAKYIKKNKFYDDIDLYICPSEFYKNKLEEGKFTKSKIVYMANPLSNDTKFNLTTPKNNYILYFGRLSKEKGVDDLIRSIKNLTFELKILGTGPYEIELKKLVKELKISDRVTFEGFKVGEVLDDFIDNAKVVVLPSKWYENGPYSAMEAMAKGKPLIVSSNGGLQELVKDGVNGYIYKDVNELTDSLSKIFALSKDEYHYMCLNSLNFAKVKFNPDNYYDTFIKYLESGSTSVKDYT